MMSVPWAGLEPALPFGNTPLKRVCLPFHHHGIWDARLHYLSD